LGRLLLGSTAVGIGLLLVAAILLAWVINGQRSTSQ
jgi:hypothetical protein